MQRGSCERVALKVGLVLSPTQRLMNLARNVAPAFIARMLGIRQASGRF